MFMGERVGERLIKGILMWVCCIFDKVDTINCCSNIPLLIENRYCRYLKKAGTKTEKPCPPFPNLT